MSGTMVRAVRQVGREVAVELADGTEREIFPWLTGSYESSVTGLHFIAAPAAAIMGRGMRFVSHSGQAAAAVTRRIVRAR